MIPIANAKLIKSIICYCHYEEESGSKYAKSNLFYFILLLSMSNANLISLGNDRSHSNKLITH